MVQSEILIIGGGAMGAAAARSLARRGRKVTLLERWAPGHDRGSSHGDGRIIRYSYREDHYVALAEAAYAAWLELERASGSRLVITTGGLDLATADSPALDDLAAGLDSRQVAYERLSRQALARRFPQIALPAGSEAIFQAAGGVVRADLALAALWRQAAARGATLVAGAEVETVAVEAGGVVAETVDGRGFAAERLVLAAGAWSAALLAQLGLDLGLGVTREQLAYHAELPAKASGAQGAGAHSAGAHSAGAHSAERMPTIIDYHTDPHFYALPKVTAKGVKCGWHRSGPLVGPDDARRFEPAVRDGIRGWVSERLPGLDPTPIEELTCLYTNTPDFDFVLDRHPAHRHVVIAAGFSGHGFKFVPAIGDIVADLATDAEPEISIAAFAADRFTGSG